MRASPCGDGDVDGALEEARVAGDGRLDLVQPRGILGAAAAALGFLTRSPRLPEPPPLNPAPPQVSIQAAHRAAVEKQQKEAVTRQVLLIEEAEKAAAIKQLQLQRAENASIQAAAARRAVAVLFEKRQKEAVEKRQKEAEARQVFFREEARKYAVARQLQLQQVEGALLATALKAWAVSLRTARAARAVEAAQRQQQLRMTQAAQAAAAVAAATAAVRAREDMMLAAVAAAAATAAAAVEHVSDSSDTDTECEVVSERSLDAVLEENKEHAKCTGDFFDFTGDESAAAGGGGSERREGTAAEEPGAAAGVNADSMEVISPELPAKPYTSNPKPPTLNRKP